MNDYDEGFQAGLKAAQAVAKEWSDVQRYVEHVAHGISEDIEKLLLCEDEGCPNAGIAHVCISRSAEQQSN